MASAMSSEVLCNGLLDDAVPHRGQTKISRSRNLPKTEYDAQHYEQF